MSATLHAIGKAEEPEPTSFAETMLRELVPSLQRSARPPAWPRQLIAELGRRLAQERGVAFIRVEHLTKEFGE
jgi:hypothetical protein